MATLAVDSVGDLVAYVTPRRKIASSRTSDLTTCRTKFPTVSDSMGQRSDSAPGHVLDEIAVRPPPIVSPADGVSWIQAKSYNVSRP
jgi:hypothetical protein